MRSQSRPAHGSTDGSPPPSWTAKASTPRTVRSPRPCSVVATLDRSRRGSPPAARAARRRAAAHEPAPRARARRGVRRRPVVRATRLGERRRCVGARRSATGAYGARLNSGSSAPSHSADGVRRGRAAVPPLPPVPRTALRSPAGSRTSAPTARRPVSVAPPAHAARRDRRDRRDRRGGRPARVRGSVHRPPPAPRPARVRAPARARGLGAATASAAWIAARSITASSGASTGAAAGGVLAVVGVGPCECNGSRSGPSTVRLVPVAVAPCARPTAQRDALTRTASHRSAEFRDADRSRV